MMYARVDYWTRHTGYASLQHVTCVTNHVTAVTVTLQSRRRAASPRSSSSISYYSHMRIAQHAKPQSFMSSSTACYILFQVLCSFVDICIPHGQSSADSVRDVRTKLSNPKDTIIFVQQ